MTPLQRLFEAPGLPGFALPPRLEELYGGGIGFSSPRVYANFVSSIDGVVALGSMRSSSSVISGKSPADRFVMGLLRACAHAVLIGAGTLRAEPRHEWTAEHIYRDAAEDYARLRDDLGLAARPELVVITASGDVDTDVPALQGALLATTVSGARKLAGRIPSGSSVLELGSAGGVDMGELIATLRARGHALILTEGGPTVIGHLTRQAVLDELFLTLSPLLAGRPEGDHRPGLAQGVDLVHPSLRWAELLSLRRHGSHLFARYSLGNAR